MKHPSNRAFFAYWDQRRGQALLFLLEWPSLTAAIGLARTWHEEMDDIENVGVLARIVMKHVNAAA